jgi:patatin-like phospholipase
MSSSFLLLPSTIRGAVILLLAGWTIGGCRAGPGLTAVPLQDAPCRPTADKLLADGLAVALTKRDEAAAANPRPLHILTVTGGIEGTPFTAGVLAGWTKSGTRPQFDVVTGISGGALIGAYAFLGPKYDSHLQRLALSLRASDLVKVRPLCCWLRSGALASSKPSERLLQTEVNDCFLADLRQAHAEGRRFFVGTMNLYTKQLVTWDVGAIAASGRPDADDLVRKVLLAAVAWPGLVPPVEFNVEVNGRWYHEEHYDGGLAAMTFVRFGSHPGWTERGARARPGCLAGSDLYVLANRKLHSEPAPVPKGALSRTMNSLTAMFESLTRSDIARLYALCSVSGMRFHLLAVPQEFPEEPLGIGDLYPREARQLFEIGYQMSAGRPPWRLTPPEAEPGEDSALESRKKRAVPTQQERLVLMKAPPIVGQSFFVLAAKASPQDAKNRSVG